mmetsp:Transcript_13334/g.31234  ORF Transcript_13334/g.31234 Transcript_13334/m.31234 type:complete len:365 (+) Transcript_13334:80-1174(+)
MLRLHGGRVAGVLTADCRRCLGLARGSACPLQEDAVPALLQPHIVRPTVGDAACHPQASSQRGFSRPALKGGVPRPRVRNRGAPGPLQEALITLSGVNPAASANDVWCGVAKIMGQANANIMDASGSFVKINSRGGGHANTNASGLSFLVNAFNTTITPFAERGGGGHMDSAAVSVFLKVNLPARNMEKMLHLLHTRFPRLVCTVTVGGEPSDTDKEKVDKPADAVSWTGTMYLFGEDRVGQLAAISEAMVQSRLMILQLTVTTGFYDPVTGEFVEGIGGPLSENRIKFAVYDGTLIHEEVVNEKVAEASQKVGYGVTSVLWDHQGTQEQDLAYYFMKRKEFILDYMNRLQASAEDTSGCLSGM